MTTVAKYLQWGRLRLETSTRFSFPDPEFHARQLVSHVLGCTPGEVYVRQEQVLDTLEQQRLDSIFEQRVSGAPFQYLTGRQSFYDCDFTVGPGVLIPRWETELLVDALLEDSRSELRVVELGAGSGNIGISVLKKKPQWEWHAFEVSPAALHYADRNRRDLLDSSAQYFLHGEDFFQGIEGKGFFDICVSNPPYVSLSEMVRLPLDVQHEPVVALFGGPDGFEVIRNWIRKCKEVLVPGGKIFFEMGASQGEFARECLADEGFHAIEILKDLAGRPRIVTAVWEGTQWTH